MLEKKIGFLMNNLLKKSNTDNSSNSEEVPKKSKLFPQKKLKGLLPKSQLGETFAENNNLFNEPVNCKNNDNPLIYNDHYSKQMSLRQKLITEVDTKNIEKKQND